MYTFYFTMRKLAEWDTVYSKLACTNHQSSPYEELLYCSMEKQSRFNGTREHEAITEEQYSATAREAEKLHPALDALKWSAWIGLVNANY